MPKRISECSKAHLINVPLPQHGSTYTVISHQFVIDYVHQALAAAGFNIVSEEYRCNADGQIAQGIHKLMYNKDPELSMMFAWTNSYNKQIKFKCLVGAYIETTGTVMVSGDMGVWIRKHMGTADTETKQSIDEQIQNAHQFYQQMVSDKNEMVDKTLDKRKKAQLLGILFAEFGILTTEQASIVRNYIERPIKSFTNPDSLWAFYNAVTIALQQSHPRTWMEDQRVLHYFIDSVYKFPKAPLAAIAPVTPVEDEVVVEAEEKGPEMDQEASEEIPNPNQISIFDVIEEEEEKTINASDLIGEYTLDEMPEVIEKLQDKIDVVQEAIDVVKKFKDKRENESIVTLTEDELASQLYGVDNDPEYSAPVIEDEVEVEVESEFALEDNIEDVITYTDPAGNTFEAPVVDTSPTEHQVHDFSEKEKLSLDDILIRIPNEEKAKEKEPDFSLDFNSSDDEEDSDFIPDLF